MKKTQIKSALLILLVCIPFCVLLTNDIFSSNTESGYRNVTLQDVESFPLASHPGSQIKFQAPVNIFNVNALSGVEIININTFPLLKNSTLQVRARTNDFFVALSDGSVSLHRGVESPFDPDEYTSAIKTRFYAQESQTGQEIVPMFGSELIDMDIDGQNIDVFGLSTDGYQYFYLSQESRDLEQVIFSQANWICQNKTNATGQLVAQPSVVSCYDRGEISGFLMNGEIVVGTSYGEVVVLYPERTSIGDGQPFKEEVIRGSTGWGVRDIKFADINLDGFVDIVFIESNYSISAFLNQNSPYNYNWTYTTIANNGVGSVPITKLLIDDLDMNGIPDIVGITNAGQMYTWKNELSFPISNTKRYTKNNFGKAVNVIKNFDLDGDSDKDLVLGLADGTMIVIDNQAVTMPNVTKTDPNLYRSHFTSNAYLYDSYTTGGGNIRSITFEDLDRDGKVDIIIGHADRKVYAMRSTTVRQLSNMYFNPPFLIYENQSATVDLGCLNFADLNYDGAKDIVMTETASTSSFKNITALINPGSMVSPSGPLMYNTKFAYRRLFYETGPIPYFTLADLDGNGKQDFVYMTIDTVAQVKATRNIINGTNFDQLDHYSFSNYYNQYQLFEYNSTDINFNIFTSDTSSFGYIMPFQKNGKLQFLTASGPLVRQVSSSDLGAFSPWDTTIDERVIAQTSGNETSRLRITSFTAAGHMKYIKDPYYGYTFYSNDAVFTDNNNVYYLMGSTGMAQQQTISTNYSVVYTGSGFLNDQFTNSSIVAVCGYGTDNVTEGFLDTVERNSATTFSRKHRVSFDSILIKMKTGDLTNDGIKDVVVLDNDGQFWICEGLEQYYGLTDGMTKAPIAKFDPNFVKDFYLEDLDNDGDLDIIVLSKSPANQIYFIKNMASELTDNDFYTATVNPEYTATSVEIRAQVKPGKKFAITPRVTITYLETNVSNDYTMIPESASVFRFVYTVGPNGTYRAEIIGNDEWFNFDKKTLYFYSDQIVSPINIVHRAFAAKNIEVWMYNTSEPIANNLININLTAKSFTEHRFFTSVNQTYSGEGPKPYLMPNVLYFFSSNNTWWINITNLKEVQEYSIGINATDRFAINYYYKTTTFEHDPNAPNIVQVYEPTYNVVLSIDKPTVLVDLEFDKDIVYLSYQVLNALGKSVLRDSSNRTIIEAFDIGEKYTSSFICNESGSLTLRVRYEDKYGNFKVEDIGFQLESFKIQNVIFEVRSDMSNEYTFVPKVYAHWRGNFVFQFRLKYKNADLNGAEEWTEWIENDPIQPSKYYGVFYDDGYPIEFKEGDYGNQTVVLELNNPFETLTRTYIIEYKDPNIDENHYEFILIIVAVAVVGVIVIRFISKKTKDTSWRSYLEDD